MPQKTITDIITCPCAEKASLIRHQGKFQCSKKDCVHSKEGRWFASSDDIPVLISEELCDTVCSPKATDIYIVRAKQSKTRSLLKALFWGTSKVTIKNCARFVDHLTSAGARSRILIIGSGEKGSGTNWLFSEENIEIVGTDIYASDFVNVIADAHYLPFADEVFDGVWIQAVLEHVVDPALVVSEIHRVLKPKGIVYAETPFMQQVHEGAYDYTRFTVLGHRYLFKKFRCIEIGGNKGVGTALTWSIRYFFWGLLRSRKSALAIALIFSLPLRLLEMFADERSLFDASSGVFFFGEKGETEISHKELIKNYRGLQ